MVVTYVDHCQNVSSERSKSVYFIMFKLYPPPTHTHTKPKRIAGKMIKKNPELDRNTYETLIW